MAFPEREQDMYDLLSLFGGGALIVVLVVIGIVGACRSTACTSGSEKLSLRRSACERTVRASWCAAPRSNRGGV